MRHLTFLLAFVASACSSTPDTSVATLCGDDAAPETDALVYDDAPPPATCGPSTDPETYDWQVRAASLDPRAFVLMIDPGKTLDVRVPAGHTWYAINAFNLKVGDAGTSLWIKSEWNPAAYSDTFFLRTLSVEHRLAFPAGTRIRHEAQEEPEPFLNGNGCGLNHICGDSDDYWHRNGTFLYFFDPAGIFPVDSRYCTNPRGLYFERMRRLETELQTRHTIVETFSGGDFNREPGRYLDEPAVTGDEYEAAIAVGVSWYEITWCTLGRGINTLIEVNNHHNVRFADAIIAPFWRQGMNVQSGLTGPQWLHWPGLQTGLAGPLAAAGVNYHPAALTGEPTKLTMRPGTQLGTTPQTVASAHGSCSLLWKKIPVTNPWSW